MNSPAEARLRPVLRDIHHWWFGTLASPAAFPADRKDIWFTQSDATDAYILEHFTRHIAEAAAIDWDLDALTREEQVALVILLDQFSRNSFRGLPKAFAQDSKAREIAGRLLNREPSRFALIERMFIAMPFEHSEAIADQNRSVALMAAIAVEASESFPDYAQWALDSFIAHRDVIRRFGRFPHRNKALSRDSMPEEQAFLDGLGNLNPSNPTERHRPSR